MIILGITIEKMNFHSEKLKTLFHKVLPMGMKGGCLEQ